MMKKIAFVGLILMVFHSHTFIGFIPLIRINFIVNCLNALNVTLQKLNQCTPFFINFKI